MSRFWLVVLVVLMALVNLPSTAQSKYDSETSKLIETGKFRDALDRLVQATNATPEDARIYASLSLLYTKIGECGLGWKYFQIAKDLGYRSSELQQGVKSVCKEPKEEKHEGILKVDSSEKGTLLTIGFSPEQQKWPTEAKLPIVRPTEDQTYCELTVTQVRKLRKLIGRTVPWLVLSKNDKFTLRIIDEATAWSTVVTEIH